MRADVERIDIGGVAVYLAERGGDTHVGLVLDVGVADEPLPVRGVTHLCERLLLTSLDPFEDLRRHGTVGWQTTQFRAVGRPDEGRRFLELVVERLGALPLERHDRERALLRAETTQRPSTMAERLLRARFGAVSFGRAGYPEYGLWQLDDASTRDWAATRCTARRAALWISGPSPHEVAARLALDLAPGLAGAPRVVDAVVDLPAQALAKVSGPNLSVVADRTMAIRAAIVLLRDHLDRTLRHERGLATAIGATCDSLDGRTLHAHVGADAAAAHRVAATTALLDEVARFAAEGPDPSFLERYRQMALDGRRVPAGRAAAAAVDHTLGRADPLDDEVDAIEALDRSIVTGALTAALERGLLVTGERSGPHMGYPRSRRGTVGPALDGVRHRAVGSDDSVVIGEHGLSFSSGSPPGAHWTVDVAGCAAVLAWDDGRRVLIGHDATHLDVAPWRFEHGRELIDAIDTTMPAALRVAMGAGEGSPVPAATGHRRRRIWSALALATTAGAAFALGGWFGSSRDPSPDERQRRSELAAVGEARLEATSRAEQMIEDGDITGGGSLRFTDARCDLPTSLDVAVFLCRADGDDGTAHTLQAQQRGVGPVTVTFVV